MKSYIQNLKMLSAVIAFASCNSNKTDQKLEQESQAETVLVENDTINSLKSDTEKIIELNGLVLSVVQEKDGYTATIESKDKKVYKATISHSNLKDAKQYRVFNSNEIVSVSGDFWTMNNENNITVREIHEIK